MNALKVYISSTAIDLKEHRLAVISAIRKAGIAAPVCMEEYSAQNILAVDKCLSDVAKCDMYIGIYAWRYGFVPEGYDGKSITELEYRKAKELGKATIIFLLDEAYEWPDELCDVKQNGTKIQALREEFKTSTIVGWFTTPDNLATEALAAITRAKDALISPIMQSAHLPRPVPNAFPTLKGCFVDRIVEQQTLNICMRSFDQKIVFIVAPGGFGKTELTLKMLHDLTDGEPNKIVDKTVNGVLYLTCLRGDLTLGRIFSETGIMIGKQTLLQNVFADRTIPLDAKISRFFSEIDFAGNYWLVLDNFEDMLDPLDDTIRDQELLDFIDYASQKARKTRILVTSRVVPKLSERRSAEIIDLSSGIPVEHAVRYLKEEGKPYGLDKEDESTLKEIVERIHCIPKALESLIGYMDQQYPEKISLKELLTDSALFSDFDLHDNQEGLKRLISQQLLTLSTESRKVINALSIYYKAVPNEAVLSLIKEFESRELNKLLSRLCKNRLVFYIEQTDVPLYGLHPLVHSFVYSQIPVDDGTESSCVEMHRLAAEYYHSKRLPKESWCCLLDVDYVIQEIKHLIASHNNVEAVDLMSILIYRYLLKWGETTLSRELTDLIIPKCSDDLLIKVYILNSNILNVLGLYGLSIETLLIAKIESIRINNRYLMGQVLTSLGETYFKLSNYCSALEHHEQAREIYQELGERSKESWSHLYIGHIYADLKDYRLALEHLEQSLAMFKEVGEQHFETISLRNIGLVYSGLDDYPRALECLEQSLEVSKKISDRQSEAEALCGIGDVYNCLNKYKSSLEYYEQSLIIFRELKLRCSEPIVLNNIGCVYLTLSNIPRALEHFELALGIAREIGSRSAEAEMLNRIGGIDGELGKSSSALDYFEQSLVIHREIGERNAEAYDLNHIADIYNQINDYPTALEYREKALVISIEIGERSLEAALLGSIGNINKSINNYPCALTYCEQSLAIFREMNLRSSEGDVLSSIGSIYTEINDYPRALENYELSLAISREIGQRSREAKITSDMANIDFMCGNYSRALSLNEQSLAIYIEIGERSGEAHELSEIGYIYKSLDDNTRALEVFKKSLTIYREIGDRFSEADVLINIGRIYAKNYDYPHAKESFDQALTISRIIGARYVEASTLASYGDYLFDLDDYPLALENYEKSLAIYRETGSRSCEAQTLSNLGKVYAELNDYPQALDCYGQSLDLLREIGERDSETMALEKIGRVYYALNDHTTSLNYFEQSLTIYKETDERSFKELLQLKIGFIYENLDDFPRALEHYEQSLKMNRENGERGDEANVLYRIGSTHDKNLEYPTALEYYNKSLIISREIGNHDLEAMVLYDIGNIYFDLADYPGALEHYDQSQAVYIELGDELNADEMAIHSEYCRQEML